MDDEIVEALAHKSFDRWRSKWPKVWFRTDLNNLCLSAFLAGASWGLEEAAKSLTGFAKSVINRSELEKTFAARIAADPEQNDER